MASVTILTDGSNIAWNYSTSPFAEVTLTGADHTIVPSNDSTGDIGYLFIKQQSNHHYNIKVPTGDLIDGGDGTTVIDLPDVDDSKVMISFIKWKSTWRIWTVSKRLQ
jgi:hypothetical protein